MAIVHKSRFTAYLTPEQIVELDRLSGVWKVSRNEALRRCVEDGIRWAGVPDDRQAAKMVAEKPKVGRPRKAGAKASGVGRKK